MGVKNTWKKKKSNLRSFSTKAAGELKILGHDGDTLGVDSAQVGVFEQGDQVWFRRFLESQDGSALEAQIVLKVLSDFTNETLEGELADQEVSALLETTDFTKSDSSGAVTVRLLDTTSGGGGLASGLGRKRLAGGLTTMRLASSLLSTSHFDFRSINRLKTWSVSQPFLNFKDVAFFGGRKMGMTETECISLLTILRGLCHFYCILFHHSAGLREYSKPLQDQLDSSYCLLDQVQTRYAGILYLKTR
jgi:hypothetical protein